MVGEMQTQLHVTQQTVCEMQTQLQITQWAASEMQKQQKEQLQRVQERKELLCEALAAQERHVQKEQQALRSKLLGLTSGLGKIEKNFQDLAQQTRQAYTDAQARAQLHYVFKHIHYIRLII